MKVLKLNDLGQLRSKIAEQQQETNKDSLSLSMVLFSLELYLLLVQYLLLPYNFKHHKTSTAIKGNSSSFRQRCFS